MQLHSADFERSVFSYWFVCQAMKSIDFLIITVCKNSGNGFSTNITEINVWYLALFANNVFEEVFGGTEL